ncbi:C40 family peptidase [Streptomyces sp. ICBB 8177]|uniref:C40 family peptidase n=1 Tax=Streptomyces sp. ICBB 8177 TaxID=563922 RepID=UPI000D680B82|nr:C40 family peptidase [Streptomyces sp. ICBB 8177]PWI43751.1 glycoside hydrolase [Streptomyces sp. ICBB 8177]
MASHRKPSPRIAAIPGPRAAIGITAAALATVTLLSENASAAPARPQPTIAQVQAEVDSLNHQAELAADRYDQAAQNTAGRRREADALLDQLAQGAQRLNDARRTLGQLADAQYRTGGLGQTAQFLLASDPQQLFEQTHTLDRMTQRQQQALSDYETQQARTSDARARAASGVQALTLSQQKLARDKATVQKKLAQAQGLLNSLTAQQKAKLAALQKQREEAAARAAAKLAAEQRQRAKQSSGGSSSGGSSSDASFAAKAAKAIAFARAQLGKPYVWGATGPNSYDCSGLTQAAWAAAGVTLPRTTWDQVKVGTRVPVDDMQPGDLVFYYSDISHVAMYIGNGQMIQAPHTGAVVDVQPVTEMPIYGVTRPA